MKKIVSLLLILAFFASCSKQAEDVVWANNIIKTDFIIDVQPIDSFWKQAEIEKNWKVEGSQDLKISSQASGRVAHINVKEGDKVSVWQPILTLSDTVANYWIALERASNNLDRAKINYESTKLTLDKQVFDSEIALEKLQSSYDALKKNTSLDLNQAKDSLKNSEFESLDSKSALQLAQVDNAIEKAVLDYNNKIIADNESLEWFKTTYKKEYNSILVFLWDIIEFWDKFFWITNTYRDSAEKLDTYLWWKNTLIRDTTKENLLDLMSYKNWTFSGVDIDNMNNDELPQNLSILNEWYELSKIYLNNLEETLNQSISSIWILSESEISAFIAAINAYQWQLQGNYTAFLIYDNTASSFLRTYENTQASIAKQIDLQRKDRDILKKNLESSEFQSQTWYDKIVATSEDNLKSLELQIKTAQNNLQNAKDGKIISLESLENAIREAEISYELASKEYEKLSVESPISGIISEISVDIWADVVNGTPLVTLIGTNNTEVEIALTNDELKYISVWDSVFTKVWEKSLTGSIYSISTISDDSLNYKVLSTFEEKIQNLGWIIDITIPITSDSILIPLKNVALVWTNKWIVHIYDNGKIVQKEVLLWKMYKDSIEFLGFLDGTQVDTNILLVVTDISNYDENKFQLKIKQ